MIAAKHLLTSFVFRGDQPLPYREPNPFRSRSGLAKLIPQRLRRPEFHFPRGNRSKLRKKDRLLGGSIEFHPTPKSSISVDSIPDLSFSQAKKLWKA
jgi:hypothetical protein